jgi:hypothetical protein
MKTIMPSVAAVLAGMLLLCGCGKSSESAPGSPPPQIINAVDFRPAFASASPELKDQADQVMMNLQASLYTKALDGLAKLAANPALNDTQKKVVGNLTEQLKKKMAAIAAPPK